MDTKMLARSLLVILALGLTGHSWAYIVDGHRINQPRLLSYAKNKLQNHGVLAQSHHGYTYLKVADRYIIDLITQFGRPGFEIPEQGAYISVIEEYEGKKLSSLAELGQTVHFNPLGFYTTIKHDKEFLMLAVDAPELSSLRQKYGLTDKLENHAFNITIGVRQLVAENELAGPSP